MPPQSIIFSHKLLQYTTALREKKGELKGFSFQ